MWSGLRQLLLDLVCIAISASIGIEEQLDKALISTTAGGVLVGCVFLGESVVEVLMYVHNSLSYRVVLLHPLPHG